MSLIHWNEIDKNKISKEDYTNLQTKCGVNMLMDKPKRHYIDLPKCECELLNEIILKAYISIRNDAFNSDDSIINNNEYLNELKVSDIENDLIKIINHDNLITKIIAIIIMIELNIECDNNNNNIPPITNINLIQEYSKCQNECIKTMIVKCFSKLLINSIIYIIYDNRKNNIRFSRIWRY